MGTFYHTTNYNPLTGDLNNMVKPNQPMEYVIDKNGNGRLVASKKTAFKVRTDKQIEKGVMSDQQARKNHVGGEVLCEVF